MTDEFLEAIQAEVHRDPHNLALREDFIALLLASDPDRAADELKVFEAAGGEPERVRILRARIMAARLRGQASVVPAEPSPEIDGLDRDRHHHHGRWVPERPRVTLDDVAGLAEVKRHLDLTFLAPLRNPEVAAAFGQTPGGSLLVYGPPGCGKTFIARAIAGDLGASFLHVALANLLSAWLGETEKAVQSLFREARNSSPCVIFVDEFDAIGGRRGSGPGRSQATRTIVTQLLEELDGVASANEGVYFLAATNRPWDIDPALRRPGRIDKTVLVLPPDVEARAAILASQLEGKPADGVDARRVAAATEDFSGADIAQVAKVALQQAMAASMEAGSVVPVTTEALLAAAADLTPSTGAWFDQVAPVLEYGVDDGTFDQLRAHRAQRGMS